VWNKVALWVLGVSVAAVAIAALAEGAYRVWAETDAALAATAQADVGRREAKQRSLELLAMDIEMGRHSVEELRFHTDAELSLFEEGGEVKERGDALPALERARRWEDDTYDFLRKRWRLEATRFRDDLGFPPQYQPGGTNYALGVTETRKMIQRRLIRLREILERLERGP
jgi:hypothetical protein